MTDMKRVPQRKHWLTAILVSAALAGPISDQVASHVPTALAARTSSSAFATSPVQTVTGKPVARVNGVVMTDRDLLREMFTIFPYAKQHNGFPKEMEADIRKGALQMIVFQELVYQQAQRQKTAVPDSRVNRALADFKKKFSSREEYQNYLRTEASGSEQALKDRIRRSLVIDAYMTAEVKNKSAVSTAEARAYYDKHPELFSYKESFAYQSISIMPPATANGQEMEEARRRAEDALRRAKATHSYQEFGLLAEKTSEDDFRVNMGDHKAVERDVLPAVVVNAALAMKPGDVSDLIQMGKIMTFFRLNAHIPAGKRKFEDVKDQLIKNLAQEKEDRLRTELDAKLHKSAKIEEL